MIYSTQELYLKYREYKTPHIKIQTELKNERLFSVVRGLYEDDRNTPGYLLSSYIRPLSYLSFEFALSRYNLIPERVYTIMSAQYGKAHTTTIETNFGTFHFQDVPKAVFRFGINVIEESGYGYAIATPEKAICDYLCKKPPVSSIKELKNLLFEDARIDETELYKLNKEDILFLCPLYGRKNLHLFMKFVEKCNEFYN